VRSSVPVGGCRSVLSFDNTTTPAMNSDQEIIKKEQEEISRQQFWHTTTVLAFTALVANLFKPTGGSSVSCREFCIATVMLAAAMLLGVHMVVVCHKEYCARGGQRMGWWGALFHSLSEVKGAFFCYALIGIEGLGLIAYLASKAGIW
jgi:hypothetical protein